jgi:hypothetical protein
VLAAPAATALRHLSQVALDKVVLATEFLLLTFKFPLRDLPASAMPDASSSSFLGSNAYWEFIADQQSETVVHLLQEQVSTLVQLSSSQAGDAHVGITMT